MLTHPTLDQLQQLGLAGMAGAFAELEANPTSAACRMPNGSLCCSTVKRASATNEGCAAGCALPGCATRRPSRTSIIVPPAVSTEPCSRH